VSTLEDRPNTALVVVDVQNGVVEGAYQRDQVVANIGRLVEAARDARVPIIWVQHASDHLVEGTESWQYVPELPRHDSEPVVHKRYGDSFEDTTLEAELAERGVGRLVVAGAQTDACIRSTIHGAFTRGYDTVLVADAHTTEDLSGYGLPTPDKVVAHTNAYWGEQEAPGRTAAVVDTVEVSFGSVSGSAPGAARPDHVATRARRGSP
jgi:isochorismate hydrolase